MPEMECRMKIHGSTIMFTSEPPFGIAMGCTGIGGRSLSLYDSLVITVVYQRNVDLTFKSFFFFGINIETSFGRFLT